MSKTNADKDIIHCHECALSVHVPALSERQKAQCPRCGYTLTTKHRNANERIIAFAITALIFLMASLPFNFLTFKSKGLENHFDLNKSLQVLIENNYHLLALIEVVTIIAIPAIVLVGLIYLLIPITSNRYPARGHEISSIIFKLLPWSMVEIFLIGALVSLIKIMSMAEISLGLSFFAYIFFSLFMTLVTIHLDENQLVKQLNHLKHGGELKISKHLPSKQRQKQHSVQNTWALLLTAIILYIPANTLPIMTTSVLGQAEPSTIIGGIILLWHSGSYPIAAIIFIASILVPIAKILILAWLNYSVQNQSDKFSMERVKWYRLAEFVGRWSMIDVFVVIILASLIQLGQTMNITPGAATLAFSGVVVVTMLAAMTFDPQLIWKNNKDNE